jgi:hypothetical protein
MSLCLFGAKVVSWSRTRIERRNFNTLLGVEHMFVILVFNFRKQMQVLVLTALGSRPVPALDNGLLVLKRDIVKHVDLLLLFEVLERHVVYQFVEGFTH